MHHQDRSRADWPYPALLPHSLKMYPVVQVAPEIGSQSARSWPPLMDPKVKRWRASHASYPNAGNQIYLHVPFCPFICHFCPLFKMKLKKSEEIDKKEAFVRALIDEIELYGANRHVADTKFNAIYFGGGTPTELDSEQLGRVLAALRRNLTITDDAEITLEGVARQMAEGDYVERALEAGFNRFSWGVQSLNLRQRKRIGRGDHVADYIRLLETIRAASPTAAVNCEIMAGLPEQSFEEFSDDLAALISWQMGSVDILYYVPMAGIQLQNLVAMNRRGPPLFGSRLLRLREHANDTLIGAGYRQVTGEVFVRDERDLFVPTGFGGGGHALNTHLALGPSAFGQIAGTVYQNVCDLERWHSALRNRRFPVTRAETLTLATARRRAAVLSLIQLRLPAFLVQGPRMHALLWRWRRRGLIRRDGDDYRLTRKGALWYNNMQVEMLTIPDLLDLIPMFGSALSIQEKLNRSSPAPDSEAYELQRLVRGALPFTSVSDLPYDVALSVFGRLFDHADAIKFTGPVAGRAAPTGVARRLVRMMRRI